MFRLHPFRARVGVAGAAIVAAPSRLVISLTPVAGVRVQQWPRASSSLWPLPEPRSVILASTPNIDPRPRR